MRFAGRRNRPISVKCLSRTAFNGRIDQSPLTLKDRILSVFSCNLNDHVGVYGSTSKRLTAEDRCLTARRARSTRPWFERFADYVITCGLIVLLLPLMVVVAIAIKCDSRGPILIWELRRRPPGREFWALKFRCTMFEARNRPYTEPEATFVGGIIRYLRIDNLPQLVNVLRGEMTCLPADPDHQFFLE